MSTTTKIPPSPTDSVKTNKSWYKSFEGWKTILEVIAIPFAIAYAVITFCQWRDLRHNFEADQRAWLKVDVAVPATLDPRAPVMVNIRNVGKSPAVELYGGVLVQVVNASSAPSFPSGVVFQRQIVQNMLFPSDPTSFTSGRTPNNPDGTLRPLDADELRRLAAGDSYLAAFGTIAYRDQFGDHWTRFCSWKSYEVGPKDFHTASCVRWNAVGDGLARWGGPEQ